MMFWGEEDSNGYLEVMTNTLADFFGGNMESGQ